MAGDSDSEAAPAGSGALLSCIITSATVGLAGSVLLNVLLRSADFREKVFFKRCFRRKQYWGPVQEVPTATSWIGPLFNTPETEILKYCGLDAVVYLRILTFSLQAMLAGAFFAAVVVALNATGDATWDKEMSDLDDLTVGHVAENAAALWGHSACIILFTAAVLKLLHHHTAAVVAMQRAVFTSEIKLETHPLPHDSESRTILVSDIPEDVDVAEAYRKQYPTFLRVTRTCDAAAAGKLAAEEEHLVGKLDVATWKREQTGERPRHRAGLMGLVGEEVDSLDTYGRELVAVQAELSAERARYVREGAAGEFRAAAFVTFADARSAVAAAQTAMSSVPASLRARMAPAATDIFWPNVGKWSYMQLQAREAGVRLITQAVCVFFMVPIAFISALSTLSNLQQALPFLEGVLASVAVRSILEGVLPGLALLVFLALLPHICMALAKQEGLVTKGQLEASQSKKIYLFLLVNVFFGNVVAGSIFAVGSDLVDDPASGVSLFAASLPATSILFANLLVLKGIGPPLIEMSQVVPAALYTLKSRYLAKSDKQRDKAWPPKPIKLGKKIADHQLFLLVGTVFACVAPVVSFCAVGYFCMHWANARFFVLFVHEPLYESGGGFWSPFQRAALRMLYIAQAVAIAILALKEAPAPAGVAAVAPLMTYAMSQVLEVRFPDLSQHPLGLMDLPAKDEGEEMQEVAHRKDEKEGARHGEESIFWPPALITPLQEADVEPAARLPPQQVAQPRHGVSTASHQEELVKQVNNYVTKGALALAAPVAMVVE